MSLDTEYFIKWAVGLPLSYITLCTFFRAINWWGDALPKGTRGSDYMAFEIVAGSSLAFFAFVGTVAWFEICGSDSSSWSYRLLDGDKFYANADFVQNNLIIPMMLYQFWNTILCLCMNDLRDPIMIVHHTLTGLLAYCATHPYACYYSLFFFGLAESTQIPLTIIDVFEKFPAFQKKYPIVDVMSKNLFGLMFFIVRIFAWTYVSYEFWIGSLDLLQQPHVHDKRVVLFMLVANIILSSMQYYWAYTILRIAISGADTPKGENLALRNCNDIEKKKSK